MQASSNGCGPSWMPRRIKAILFNWFFEASCDKHDQGYTKGGNELRRWVCDARFLLAMLRDARSVPAYFRPFALIEAVMFYIIVASLGWTRFNYR